MLSLLAVSTLMVACMPQGETIPANLVNEIPGNDEISVKPSMLCGKGRAVVGVDQDGQVACGSKKLSGLVGNCYSGESSEAVAIGVGEAESMLLPLCSVDTQETPDDTTLGTGPTEEFKCPSGSALVGFSEIGEPLCSSIVGADLAGVALIMPADECPMGMNAGHLNGADYSIPLCKYDQAARRQMKLSGQRVVKFPFQANTVCASGSVVIGFDENHRILCGSGPKQFKKKVSRFIATEFAGHVESPICPPSYEKKDLRLVTSSNRNIKLWTCVRADLKD